MAESVRFPSALWRARRWIIAGYLGLVAAAIIAAYVNPVRWFMTAIVVVNLANVAFVIVMLVHGRLFRARLRSCGFVICPACGYSLRGLPPRHRCPECGATYDLDDLKRQWQAWLGSS